MTIKYERYENGALVESVPYSEEELLQAKEKAVITARNLERGSLEEQWEYFIDNGYVALKDRDEAIKARHPKP